MLWAGILLYTGAGYAGYPVYLICPDADNVCAEADNDAFVNI